MEALQIVYIVLAFVGAVFLLISIFGGDTDGVDLDVGDADFDISDAEASVDSVSIISMRTISTLILTFGIAGSVVFIKGGGIGSQLIWGTVISVAVTFVYYLIMKFMYSMQGSSMSSAHQLIGKIGRVTIPTTDTGIGQVAVATTVGNTEYTCREKDGKKLKQNDPVKIVSSEGAGLLTVEKV